MLGRTCKIFVVGLVGAMLVSACGWNPLGIPDSFEISTTSELGPETLERIDAINETVATGVEIGPETREVIRELNQTIDDGIRFGFTDSTLARIDRLLEVVEAGVGITVGLDSETNATVNELIDTIDEMPDQWEDTATQIIETLEGSTSRVGQQMAQEVRGIINEARLNTQYVTATVGVEFRCNVDFMSARSGDTINQFIGRSLVGRLREIISGQKYEEPTPIPWVCQILPDQVDLISSGGSIVAGVSVIKISGYNFIDETLPNAYIVDESGARIEGAGLYPFLTSPYQVQLNLQSLDFSTIPARSRIVFEWPQQSATSAIALVFPTVVDEPTPVPVAQLTITMITVEVREGPGMGYNAMGRAENGAVYEVIGRNGDTTWWQIDYDGHDAWVPVESGTRNEIEAPVVSIPLPPPEAIFSTNVSTGQAPLEVRFTDLSTGDPTSWQWDFGDGATSTERNPTHSYANAGTYTVKLSVSNRQGSDLEERGGYIVVSPAMAIVRIPDIIVLPPLMLRPTATPGFDSGGFLVRNYVGLGSPVFTNTGIRTSDYDCGIVGMAVLSGDINEYNRGNIIYAYMSQVGATWWINADFRTHEDHESWNVSVLCVPKAYAGNYQYYPRIRVEPESHETISLEELGIPAESYCFVFGIAAWNGDIEENDPGDIIKAYLQKNASGTWELTANFKSQRGAGEYWDVDVMCIYENPNVLIHREYYNTPGNVAYDTSISASQYACMIGGYAGINGDIQENGGGNIVQVYTYIGSNNNWYVKPDFRSHITDERWNVNLVCLAKSKVTMEGLFGEGWPR